jgi:chromosome segregation ATPase
LNLLEISFKELGAINEESLGSKEKLYAELSADISTMRNRLNDEIALRKEYEFDLKKLRLHAEKLNEELMSSTQLCNTLKSQVETIPILSSSVQDLQEQVRLAKKNFDSIKGQLLEEQERKEQIEQLLEVERQKLLDRESIIDKQENKMEELKSFLEKEKLESLQQRSFLESQLQQQQLSTAAFEHRPESDIIQALRQSLNEERRLRLSFQSSAEASTMVIADLESEVEQLNQKMKEHNDWTHSIQQSFQQFKTNTSNWERMLSVSNEQLESIQRKADGTRQECLRMKQQMEIDKSSIAKLESERANLEQTVNSLQNEMSNSQKERYESQQLFLSTQRKDREELRQVNTKFRENKSQLEQKIRQVEKMTTELAIAKHQESELKDWQAKHARLLDERTQENQKLLQEAVELNKKISDLNSSCQKLASEKDEVSRVLDETRKDLSKATGTIAKLDERSRALDAVTREQEQLKQSFQSLQVKLGEVEQELSKVSNTAKRLTNDRDSLAREREMLISENIKVNETLDDERKKLQEFKDECQGMVKYFDDQTRRIDDLASNIKHDASEPTGLVQRLETLFEQTDISSKSIQEFHLFWSQSLKTRENEYFFNGAIVRCVQSVLQSLDISFMRAQNQRAASLAKRISKLCSDIQYALQHQESLIRSQNQELAQTQQGSAKALEDLKTTMTARIYESDRIIVDLRETLRKEQTEYSQNITSLSNQLNDLKRIKDERERNLSQLQQEFNHLSQVKEENRVLGGKIARLEQQLNENVERLGYAESANQVLRNELEEQDPEYIAELKVLKQAQDEVLELKQRIRRNSNIVEQPSMDTILPSPEHVMAVRKRMKSISAPSQKITGKQEWLEHIEKLHQKITFMEQEYRNATESWTEMKRLLEEKFNSERQLLSEQLEQHQEALKNLESLLAKNDTAEDGNVSSKPSSIVDAVVRKLEKIRKERLRIDHSRMKNEQLLKEGYEYQIQQLHQDLLVLRHELQKVEEILEGKQRELIDARADLDAFRKKEAKDKSRQKKLEKQIAELSAYIPSMHNRTTVLH